MYSIGEIISTCRKKKGLLQQDLADELAKEGITLFPIKPYPTGREILLNQALPYFTKCVESLVLLICMRHILE